MFFKKNDSQFNHRIQQYIHTINIANNNIKIIFQNDISNVPKNLSLVKKLLSLQSTQFSIRICSPRVTLAFLYSFHFSVQHGLQYPVVLLLKPSKHKSH